MLKEKNLEVIDLPISKDLKISVIRNENHEYIMSTNDVALGFAVEPSTIRSVKHRKPDELKENEHFVTVAKCNGGTMLHWTKKGIIRLGFFLKGERAKFFRDWAESVILNVEVPKLALPKPKRRKHNRLTQERLVKLLGLVSMVENSELRKALVNELVPSMEIPLSQLQLSLHSQNPII